MLKRLQDFPLLTIRGTGGRGEEFRAMICMRIDPSKLRAWNIPVYGAVQVLTQRSALDFINANDMQIGDDGDRLMMGK